MGKINANADMVRKNKLLKKKVSIAEAVKTNPFETKYNKRKFDVVGQKVMKSEHGMPGVSRSKSIHKRQAALLTELKTHRKVNKLKDRRIGEKNPHMSVEDKILERFSREQKRLHEKFVKYNLDDDKDDGIDLTHRGQSLREAEQFDDPVDSDDPDDAGIIEGEQQEGHFGGGEEKTEWKDRSFKDKMEELVAKSKIAKMEKRTEKEEIAQMTSELDSEWKDLHNSVASKKLLSADDETLIDPKGVSDYDLAVNTLTFEPRGTPSDRLKTEMELAKIEKEKLDKLEEERMERMKGISKLSLQQSADDLDDGMDYGDVVVYDKDGNLVVENREEESGSEGGEEPPEVGMEEMMQGSDEDEEDFDVGSEGESSESEDQFSDLDSDGESEEETPKAKKLKTLEKSGVKTKNSLAETDAFDEIPYTFNVPREFPQLLSLLEPYTTSQQNVVLIRMRKCHHVSLAYENKQLLQKLFGQLLEYYGEASMKSPPNKELINMIMLHLRDLSKQFPTPTSQTFKLLLMKRYGMFTEYCKRKKGKGVWPFLDTLLYLRLVSVLYPASDFRHEIVTPAMLFVSEIFTSCPTTNHRDTAVGLLLSTVVLEYTSFSKNVFPECLNFLTSLLMSADRKAADGKATCGTSVCKTKLLVSKSKAATLRSQTVQPFNLTQVIALGVGNSIYNTDQFIISALYTTTALMLRLTELYKEHSSASALLRPTAEAVGQLDIEIYPEKLQDILGALRTSLSQVGPQKLSFVSKEKRKPKMIRLYEPLIVDLTYDERRKPKEGFTPAQETQHLKQMVKKEMKSAMREIRRDREFISKEKIRERMQGAAEREKKTKQIMGLLEKEQHHMNEFRKEKEKTRSRRYVK